jgi:lipid-A-disaccharide synthase
LESGADKGDGAGFRERHGISGDETLIAVLPGSRMGEVSRLQGIFGQALFGLSKKHPNLRAVVPTMGAVAGTVRQAAAGWSVPTLVVEGDTEKYDAFAAADVALAASGTVALELAMAGTPAVVAYRINPLSALVANRLLKVRFFHLVNLILDREAVPEFIQDACRAEFLAHALEDLLMDEDRRQNQVSAYNEAIGKLSHKGSSPANRAASAVLDVIAQAESGD